MKEKSYPNFLCIGAQKAGTTWLFINLFQHPEIWLPPIKEIHYLHRREKGILIGWKSLRNKRWREKLYQCFKRDIVNFSYSNLIWDMKYYFGLRTDGWYKSIFEPGKNKVSGDITPAYSTMSESAVAHAYSIMPHAKIIFIMRNPIERAWSSVKMSFDKKLGLYKKGNEDFKSINDSDLIQLFIKKGLILRSDYLRTIKIWESQYPSDQILYIFTEEIERRPRKLLLDIYKFIGVTAEESYIPQQVEKKVTPSSEHTISNAVNVYLAELYYKQIEQLANRFSTSEVNYAKEWLVKVEKLLDSRNETCRSI